LFSERKQKKRKIKRKNTHSLSLSLLMFDVFERAMNVHPDIYMTQVTDNRLRMKMSSSSPSIIKIIKARRMRLSCLYALN
jgi:hypothetical protein